MALKFFFEVLLDADEIEHIWLTEDNNNIDVAFFPTYVPSPGTEKA